MTRRFPVATSIVSKRSSRSYSHQSFYQVTRNTKEKEKHTHTNTDQHKKN